jgi:ubiquinone/menaquinone biosynthesis C-methylase UbiE
LIWLIVWLNRVFQKPRVGGRESAAAYSDWEYRWGQSLVREYLEPAGDLKGKRVLDVGCGLGGKTVAYGEGGAAEAYGIDLSLKHVEASVQFAAANERPYRWFFFVGDAARLPSTSDVFDVVIANDAMEHFAEPEIALGEMARVTRPGGAIWVFFTPHFSPLGSHLYDYIFTPWCHLLFGRRDLEGAVREVLRRRFPEWSPGEVDCKTSDVMRSYDTELNHMSIVRFRRMVSELRGIELTYEELKPAKYRCLKFLTRLRFVRELVTGTVVCRLERVSTADRVDAERRRGRVASSTRGAEAGQAER